VAEEDGMKARLQPMITHVRAYLAARRALGVKLEFHGHKLVAFATWVDRRGCRGPLTEAVALEWARASPRATRVGQAWRLRLIRPFARWLQAREPDTEVPASGLLGPTHRQRKPHIFTDEEVARILCATAELRPASGFRPRTFRVLFGLLACTGLRPGEAVRLTRRDVDLKTGCLTVQETKFHKSRLVPLHRTATRALRSYARARDRQVPHPGSDAFFLLDAGLPVTLAKTHRAFKQVRKLLGWAIHEGRAAPRLYDFRHRFACHRILRWHTARLDVNQRLASLSTYMGHVKVTDTYWYMSAVPELLAVCAARFERFAASPDGGVR
jgi:integrase/recombinase XerD